MNLVCEGGKVGSGRQDGLILDYAQDEGGRIDVDPLEVGGRDEDALA